MCAKIKNISTSRPKWTFKKLGHVKYFLMLNDAASVSIWRTQLVDNVDIFTAEVTVAESRHIQCETRTFDSYQFLLGIYNSKRAKLHLFSTFCSNNAPTRLYA